MKNLRAILITTLEDNETVADAIFAVNRALKSLPLPDKT